jgi:hypothetical protein
MFKITIRYARYVIVALAAAAFLGAGFSDIAFAGCGGCFTNN